MKEVCVGISKRYYFWFDALSHEGDHIYIIVETAPKNSPSRIMLIRKIILAIHIFKKFPDLKNKL